MSLKFGRLVEKVSDDCSWCAKEVKRLKESNKTRAYCGDYCGHLSGCPEAHKEENRNGKV